MAEGLTWEQVQNPMYIFEQSAAYVASFGMETRAPLIDPVRQPMAFAEAVAPLNPRHGRSVFKQSVAEQTETYAARYAIADNGMPAWVAPGEPLLNQTAHTLGIRDAEIGTTFQHDFSPQGAFALGLVLEGANHTSKTRADAMVAAIKRGAITVDEMVVVGTGRKVSTKEGHGDIAVGYGVAAKVVEELQQEFPDIFGREGIPLRTLNIEIRSATTRDVLTEATLRLMVGSIVMVGSNIYGSWMRTDMATVQHTIPRLKRIGFGAGPDNPKAARTPLIWAAEVAQTIVSAAHLQHARNTKHA